MSRELRQATITFFYTIDEDDNTPEQDERYLCESIGEYLETCDFEHPDELVVSVEKRIYTKP